MAGDLTALPQPGRAGAFTPLLHMKLALLRASLTGVRSMTTILGAVAGLAAAGGTGWLALDAPPDLLCLVFAAWALGWLFGPVFLGGGEADLRPEYFAALPIRPRRLATGLFTASLAGIGPLVTLGAYSAGALHATTTASMITAVVVTPVQVVVVLLASKLVTELTRAQLTSTARAVVAALPWAVAGAFVAQFWLLLPAIAGFGGFLPSFSVVLRLLPSSWGLVAIDAVARGDWAFALLPIAGLITAILLLGALWSRLIVRRTSEVTTTAAREPGWDLAALLPLTRIGAVAAKELRTWVRDLDRALYLAFALFFGLAVTLVPLLAGERASLAATGLVIAVLATSGSAQLYGSDGTALWLTLLVPGAERADVRGRQLAWLLLTAPVAVVATAAGLPLSGVDWAWPWVLSLLPAALGAGAGLAVLVSVFALVPQADPKNRVRGAVGGDGTAGLITWAMLPLTLAAIAPAAVLPLLGSLLGNSALSWAGVPAGVTMGAGAAWWLGRLSHRRLRDSGTVLLLTMRSGRRPVPAAAPELPMPVPDRVPGLPMPVPDGVPGLPMSAPDAVPELEMPDGKALTAWEPMPVGKALAAWGLYLAGAVLVLAQAVVAFALSRLEVREPTWFLALHLPAGLRVPAMVVLAVAGAGAITGGWLLTRHHDKPSRKRYHLP